MSYNEGSRSVKYELTPEQKAENNNSWLVISKSVFNKFYDILNERLNNPYDTTQKILFKRKPMSTEQTNFKTIFSAKKEEVASMTRAEDVKAAEKALFRRARELFPETGDFPRIERIIHHGTDSYSKQIFTNVYRGGARYRNKTRRCRSNRRRRATRRR